MNHNALTILHDLHDAHDVDNTVNPCRKIIKTHLLTLTFPNSLEYY